ncbi:DUF6461 domain-containing protein [Amorphoplanes digitatis]|uniref:Uncharacterized protein n=1 Tax=Actinoplanes digitatis TaxID=1868 RepID=A0A7W7HZG3_9ACTN|nr:DUF6461 domain-containing protein [Actinoplanes digitatis]MBB4763618.1 hypothetical protein [Actinoplanes digitatis]BFE72775.1 hypothetical protein GCM10020092_060760 [Actinoplanes digitatis]GID93123.1 hypothetical protein Adi01nite_25350 [Actinoplanes digitatis]
MDDLEHARRLIAELGESFCLTFVKDAGPGEALARMGGCPDTLRERGPGELSGPATAAAVPLGAWTVVIEPGGGLGADHALLETASRGSAAVSVLRGEQSTAHFGYAVDGTTVAGFDPGYPTEETIWGADPGMLRHLMDALGLRPPSDDTETTWQDAEARAIVLAQRITGVRVPEAPLGAARLSARLEPWFVTPARPGDLLRAGRRAPHAADLVAAAEAAAPGVQRAVAVAEVRRQAAALGVADAPGLTEALDAAATGAGTGVAADSPLGLRVRDWLAAPGDDGLGWFVMSLRGVLGADPRVAVLAALRPLATGPAALADDAARESALRDLRGQDR